MERIPASSQHILPFNKLAYPYRMWLRAKDRLMNGQSSSSGTWDSESNAQHDCSIAYLAESQLQQLHENDLPGMVEILPLARVDSEEAHDQTENDELWLTTSSWPCALPGSEKALVTVPQGALQVALPIQQESQPDLGDFVALTFLIALVRLGIWALRKKTPAVTVDEESEEEVEAEEDEGLSAVPCDMETTSDYLVPLIEHVWALGGERFHLDKSCSDLQSSSSAHRKLPHCRICAKVQAKRGEHVWATQGGKRFHLDPNCRGLRKAKHECKKIGYCHTCAAAWVQKAEG